MPHYLSINMEEFSWSNYGFRRMVPWGPGTILLLPWSNLFCLIQKMVSWFGLKDGTAVHALPSFCKMAVTARANSGTYEKKDLKFGKKSLLPSNWVPWLTKRFFSLHILVFEFFTSILTALKGGIYKPQSRALRCMPFAGLDVDISNN